MGQQMDRTGGIVPKNDIVTVLNELKRAQRQGDVGRSQASVGIPTKVGQKVTRPR